jgi:hypothetical protein
MSKEFTYEIKEEIATLSTKGGWSLELNRISWNGRPATYDLRKWSDDHSRMGKGITLNDDEMAELIRVMTEEAE